jgi:hypothetical protein
MSSARNRKYTPVETGPAGKIVLGLLVVAVLVLGYFLFR